MNVILKFIQIFIFFFIMLSKGSSEEVHQELLNKLEALYPIEINFVQINNNNKKINGWMIIGGKGLARTEFEPPNNLVIIADGKWIIFHDALYDRTTYLPLNKGAFKALLNPSKLNNDKNLKITKEVKANNLIFKVSANDLSANDELLVYFDLEEENNLLGWEIVRNKDVEIKVLVNNSKKLKEDILKNRSYFILSEDMKKQKKVFKGPFKRSIKKIPNHGKPM